MNSLDIFHAPAYTLIPMRMFRIGISPPLKVEPKPAAESNREWVSGKRIIRVENAKIITRPRFSNIPIFNLS